MIAEEEEARFNYEIPSFTENTPLLSKLLIERIVVVHGFTVSKDRAYRHQACDFIFSLGTILRYPVRVMSTASVYFHRFFLRFSYRAYKRYIVAAACIILASKIEEAPLKLDTVLEEYNKLLSQEPFQKNSKEYNQLRDSVMNAEAVLMTIMGCNFEVIHPYELAVSALRWLTEEKATTSEIGFVAWQLLRMSYRGTMCLQFSAQQLALSALFLAFVHRCIFFSLQGNLSSTSKESIPQSKEIVSLSEVENSNASSNFMDDSSASPVLDHADSKISVQVDQSSVSCTVCNVDGMNASSALSHSSVLDHIIGCCGLSFRNLLSLTIAASDSISSASQQELWFRCFLPSLTPSVLIEAAVALAESLDSKSALASELSVLKPFQSTLPDKLESLCNAFVSLSKPRVVVKSETSLQPVLAASLHSSVSDVVTVSDSQTAVVTVSDSQTAVISSQTKQQQKERSRSPSTDTSSSSSPQRRNRKPEKKRHQTSRRRSRSSSNHRHRNRSSSSRSASRRKRSSRSTSRRKDRSRSRSTSSSRSKSRSKSKSHSKRNKKTGSHKEKSKKQKRKKKHRHKSEKKKKTGKRSRSSS
jgi:protein BUR2